MDANGEDLSEQVNAETEDVQALLTLLAAIPFVGSAVERVCSLLL